MSLRYATSAAETYSPPLTIRHLLDANPLGTANQDIVYRDQVRLTYTDLRNRVSRLASMLAVLGVREGVTVAMLDWDSHRYLEALFAVPMMGAVLQTANIRLSREQLRYTLADAGAEIVLVHRDFLPLIGALREDLPHVRTIIALMDGVDEAAPDWCAGEYEVLLAAADPAWRFVDFDENALATTFYTSGTTGLPKPVCFSHRQLVLHTLALAAAFGTATGPGLRRDHVYMPLTPMFHVHAWGLPYAATMLGLKQVYPGKYEPDVILHLRRREGVTFSHCVPTVLQMVIAAADAAGARLDGWHLVIGGSALTTELHDEAVARGAPVTPGYGMSETGPVIAIGRTGTAQGLWPIPLVSAQIVDTDMRPAAADGDSKGELVLRAPWLTASYPGDDAASAALWRGGWLHTQDIATIAPDGAIRVRDRLKDVIKTGGEWICSLTLEDLIVARPDVAEVAVVGVPHPKWQERPVAVIVAAADRQPTLDDVRETLSLAVADGRISRLALVDAVVCVAALPRTTLGKIDKKAIRQTLSDDTASGVRS